MNPNPPPTEPVSPWVIAVVMESLREPSGRVPRVWGKWKQRSRLAGGSSCCRRNGRQWSAAWSSMDATDSSSKLRRHTVSIAALKRQAVPIGLSDCLLLRQAPLHIQCAGRRNVKLVIWGAYFILFGSKIAFAPSHSLRTDSETWDARRVNGERAQL